MINDKIKQLREKHDWTQLELADKLGVSKSSVSQWENGMKEPRMGMIQKIADLFNVTKSYLIEENMEDTPLDPDALEILDMLESNLELKMLFMKTGKLSDADKKRIAKIIQASLPEEYDD